jgi:hypothetical protein
MKSPAHSCLIVIGVLIVAVVWTGRSQRWFKSNVTLRIVLPEAGAAGIRQGSEVYFLGTARLPEITGALANESKDLPGLVQQTQTSMRELERLIEAMQRHWFLRKYVNQTNPPPLRALPAGEEPSRKPVKASSPFKNYEHRR